MCSHQLQSFDVYLPSLLTLNRINVRHFYPRFSAELASSVLAHQTQAIVKCIIAQATHQSPRPQKSPAAIYLYHALFSYNQLHFSRNHNHRSPYFTTLEFPTPLPLPDCPGKGYTARQPAPQSHQLLFDYIIQTASFSRIQLRPPGHSSHTRSGSALLKLVLLCPRD